MFPAGEKHIQLRFSGFVFRQRRFLQRGIDRFPESSENILHVGYSGSDRQHQVLFRHDHDILSAGSIPPESVETGAPELVAVPQFPVGLFVGGVVDLETGRLFHIVCRNELFAVPVSVIQQQTAETEQIFRLEMLL